MSTPDATQSATAATSTTHVLFVVLPDSLILDWAGPAEAFRIANALLKAAGQAPQFQLQFVGPESQVRTSVFVALADVQPLPQQLAANTWVVLVGTPGVGMDMTSAAVRSTLAWLQGLQPGQRGLRLITICAGALLAAHAGLLRGRRATTHHHHLDDLRHAAPDCDVVANRVFVLDDPLDALGGTVCSSAGITTGIDLALHLVAQTCGPALAAQVAQTMVVALRRGPHDPELSPFLAHRNHLHAALHRVQDAVCAQPTQAWDVPSMAAVACTSPRHLTRLFVGHAGIAPLHYLRGIRLALAQQALQSGHNVTQAAALAGFSSDTQLRRAWHALGVQGTPTGRA
jgi:transcriptional regulator GlxA family with amidase domain